VGHKAIARVAEKRLSRDARKAVQSILGVSGQLEDIALCADDVLYVSVPMACGGFVMDPKDFAQTQPWHYLDVPLGTTPRAAPLASHCANGTDCPISQIRLQAAVLKDPKASQAQKQVALLFVVHFVGDIHMPLHVRPNFGDRGANDRQLTYMGEAKNLHHLWDGLLLAGDLLAQKSVDPTAWAERIDKIVAAQQVPDWTAGDRVENAGWESFEISRDVIYPDYALNQDLGVDYQTRMTPIVERRLAQAGVLLAAVLDDALAPEAAVPAAPAGHVKTVAAKVLQMLECGPFE
jgi:hypothetical protein